MKLVSMILWSVLTLFSCQKEDELIEVEKSPLKMSERLAVAIPIAEQYLNNQIQFNGKFKYWTNINPQVKVKRDYNILRHAGALYSLIESERIEKEPEFRKNILKSLHFLWGSTVRSLGDGREELAVWSDPQLVRDGGKSVAKLGATGLGLMVFSEYEMKFPGHFSRDSLNKLGEFLVYMQKPDGSFYSKYSGQTGLEDSAWVSLYYPGEAALGLLSLYDLTGAERWADLAKDALLYLADSRRDSIAPPDHWALIATERLANHKNYPLKTFEKEKLLYHANQIVDVILAEQISASENPIYRGGFDIEGRTTPTSTRLEGLLAAQKFLDRNLKESIEGGLDFLLRSQVARGEFVGAIPRAISPLFKIDKAAERFNRRVGEVRIDYVQHALSAFRSYTKVYQ